MRTADLEKVVLSVLSFLLIFVMIGDVRVYLPIIKLSLPSGILTTIKTSTQGVKPSTIKTSSPSVKHSTIKTSSPSVKSPTIKTSSPSVKPSTTKTSSPSVNPPTIKTSTQSVKPPPIKTSSPSVKSPPIKTSSPSVKPSTTKTSSPSVNPPTIKTSTQSVKPPPIKTTSPSVKPPTIKTSSPSVKPPTIKTSSPSVKSPTIKTSSPSVKPSTTKTSSPSVNPPTIKNSTQSVKPPPIKTSSPSVKPSTIKTSSQSVKPSTIKNTLPTIKTSTISDTLPTTKTSSPSVKPPKIKTSIISDTLPTIKSLTSSVSFPTIKSSTSSVSLPTTKSLVPYKMCPIFVGRLENHMFIFASSYAIGKSKGIRVEMEKNSYLLTIFDLDVDIANDKTDCRLKKYRTITEHKAAAYDGNIVNFTPTISVHLTKYLQSWRYFDKYADDIRKQFTFKKEIKQVASKIIDGFLLKNNVTNRSRVTLVGVHIRRGDRVELSKGTEGFKVATKEYIHQSVKWYQDRFQSVMFVVGSNGIEWAKENMPKNITVMYLENNLPWVDMATLAMCDQFISTIGSFGWWCGWLTGGNVTYYKWPAFDGGSLRQHYSETNMDHFYPHWIGL